MSYQIDIIEGYEELEATNDHASIEGISPVDNYINNIIDLHDAFHKRETINAFKKILSKEIIFD
ncbi:hypothetical protein PGO63_19960 [Klebsiella aerogenes]|uniref:Uncharacterized protein n=1 Tax=Salmonella enteritidis TaxID=149539 RepID=A0A3R0QCZ2_SALEN|nr:hypothetical protein [Salmonella enterica subsp. diarizonae]EED4922835.1 hypothetical protein [Salmonella enterica subsp. arizonae]MJY20398.1 hypothetical protein [Salmonella enterica subsp. enterica serovar Enteritidis]